MPVFRKGQQCMRCTKCRRWKEISCFLEREDRVGHYEFCTDCMKEQGRASDYPPAEEQGGGRLDLEPRD